MTKIDIFSGFLGAGKTTLIKKLIEEGFEGEKIVLIENEFGEIGIDGGFLKDAGIEITEMNSGCICCTLVGDFAVSMKQVMDQFHPDRILIEPSGVGKLSDVMASVIDMEKTEDVKLNALVTVVNALKAKKQMKAFGEFFNNQIEHATTVILSRSQSAKPEEVEACMKQIQALNEKAAIITTPWDDLDGKKIVSVMEGQDNLEIRTLAMTHHEHDKKEHEEHHHHDHEHHHEHHEHHHHEDVQPLESAGADGAAQGMQSSPASGAPLHTKHEHEHHHEHGHHHADEIFDTWGKETAHVFTKETIENAMQVFANGESCGVILRSKGMVPQEDGEWIYFDLVDGEYELRTGAPDYTGRLVVIGTDLNHHKIEEVFGLA